MARYKEQDETPEDEASEHSEGFLAKAHKAKKASAKKGGKKRHKKHGKKHGKKVSTKK